MNSLDELRKSFEDLEISPEQWNKKRSTIRFNEICPPLFKNADGNFPTINQEALTTVLRFDPDSTKGLVLTGETGKGKTTAAWMLLKKLSYESSLMIRAIRDPEFSREYSKRLGNGTADEWVDKLCGVDVLFIDDLGKAAVTPRYKEQLYDVIDSRINKQKPTIVTTQYNRSKLIERFGDEDGKALVRRFLEFSEIINF